MQQNNHISKIICSVKKNTSGRAFSTSLEIHPSRRRNGFTDKKVILSHVGTGMIVWATWNQTEQSMKTQVPWPMAHGGRRCTKATIQRVETSNRGNGNQD
jgi:hypothetical protein